MMLQRWLRLLAVGVTLPFLFNCAKKSGSSNDGASATVTSYYLYSANSGSGDISMFSVNPTKGLLTSIGANVAHGNDGNIYAFGVNSVTGALTALSTPSYSAGTGSGGVRSLFLGALQH